MPNVIVPPGIENPALIREWLEQDIEPELEQSRLVTHTFAAADTEERIRHRLPNRPKGFQVVGRDRACAVYRDENATAADRFYVYVKCDTASAKVTLRVF